MAPTFSDLGEITFLMILAVIPFFLLGAVPFTMLVFLGLVLIACLFCRSL